MLNLVQVAVDVKAAEAGEYGGGDGGEGGGGEAGAVKEAEGGVGLKAEMTLLNGCTVIIGCIIGSGIFVSPTGVLVCTGSVNMSIVVWTISGFFTMIGDVTDTVALTSLILIY